MPVAVDRPIAVLSEGIADKNFLELLINNRMQSKECCFPFPNGKFHSSSMFDKMLSALKGDGVGYAQLKGVILIADSCDKPSITFDQIAQQVRTVGGFAVPSLVGDVAMKAGAPCVCIHTLPDNATEGGLETLFNADLAMRHPTVSADAAKFLATTPSGLEGWNAEKRSKSHFATLVAATHRDDPSRAAAYAWRDPPTVHIGSPAFDALAKAIATTIDKMLA